MFLNQCQKKGGEINSKINNFGKRRAKMKTTIFFRGVLISIAVALLLAYVGVLSAQVTLTPKEQLGKSIFFDENLSIEGNQSCASCHDPAWGWTGDDSAINAGGSVYEGSIAGRFGDRKPPTSAYATPSPIFHNDKGTFTGGNFWDGRATGELLGNPAADQARGPFLNPVHHVTILHGAGPDLIRTSMQAAQFMRVRFWVGLATESPPARPMPLQVPFFIKIKRGCLSVAISGMDEPLAKYSGIRLPIRHWVRF